MNSSTQILGSLILGSISSACLAELPSCSHRFDIPSTETNAYTYGNFRPEGPVGYCTLQSGTGISVHFTRGKNGNPSSVLVHKEVYGKPLNVTVEALVFSDSVEFAQLKDWAIPYFEANRGRFQQVVPLAVAGIDRQIARIRQDQSETQARLKQAADADAKAELDKRQADAAINTQQVRDSLQGLNPGQLFAKADELSARGDTANAREVLRALVGRFPDHPLSATAAQQMAGMGSSGGGSGGQATSLSSPTGNSGTGATGGLGSAESIARGGGDCATLQMRQGKAFESLNLRPAPQGSTPLLQRIMYMTSEGIKLIKAHCPDSAENRQQIQSYQRAYDEANTACGQMLAGGRCPGPNPY